MTPFARRLALLFSATFGIFAYSNVYFFLASLLQARGVSPQAAGIAVSLFYTSTLLFRPAGGWLVEGLGLRATLVGSALVAFAGSVGLAFAGASLPLVYACRVLMGAGYSSYMVAYTAYQNLAIPPERRGFAFSIIGMAAAGPSIFLIPVADWLIRHGHLMGYLAISPLMALVCAGIGWSFGNVSLSRGASRKEAWGTYRELFSLAPMRALLISMFLLSLTDGLLLCVGILLASKGLVPSAFMATGAASIVAIRLATLRVIDRVPRPLIAAPSFGVMALGFAALSLTRSNLGAVLCGMAYGFGVGMGWTAHLAMVADMAHERLRPKASAMIWFAMDLGWAVTSFVFGLLSPVLGNAMAFGGYAALLFIGALLTWQFLWKPVIAMKKEP